MDTNKYEIVLTDTAKEELNEIYEYISKQLYEEKAANRLMNKIEHSILILEENPYCCKEVHIKPHDDVYRKLVIDNYIALYDILKKIEIKQSTYAKYEYVINKYLLPNFEDKTTEKYIEPRNYQFYFKKILRKCKIKGYKFHMLRHFLATECIAVGMDVKTLSVILGHSSVEVTLNRYAHSDFKKQKKYLERL